MPRRPDQTELPYAEAEGIDAERRAAAKSRRGLVVAAAAALKFTLAERELLVWISNVQDSGDGLYRKSMEQVASYGEGLCCSPSSARRVVHGLVARGLVVNEEQSDGKKLALRVDWNALRTLKNAATTPDRQPRTPSKLEGVDPCQIGRGTPSNLEAHPSQIERGTPSKLEVPYKEYSPSSLPSLLPTSSADADAWEAAADVLRIARVFAVTKAIAAAQSHGYAPNDVIRFVREWLVNQDKFSRNAGGDTQWAILKRIDEGVWPTTRELADPDVVAERLAQREAQLAAKQAVESSRDAVAREQAAGERRRAEELEAFLDSLDDAARDELAARTFSDARLLANYRGGLWRNRESMVRAALLVALERETTPEKV